MKITKLQTNEPTVYRVYFEAAAYPALCLALELSGLTTKEGGTWMTDYVLRQRERLLKANIRDRDILTAHQNFDSVVQLFRGIDGEAQWIPLCEELFREQVDN